MSSVQSTESRPAGPARLLLVEDSRIFADLLADRMRGEEGVTDVDVASSVAEACTHLLRHRPDVVFLDLHLVGEVGLDLLPHVRVMEDPPGVLMLSGAHDTRQVVGAFAAGADGWVDKTERFDTLMGAAHEVFRGNMYLTPGALRPVIQYLLGRDRGAESFVDTLSARQLEVLRCLVSGMSRAECAQRLHLSVNTVRTHVQALLKRADVHSTLALASLARSHGVRGIDEAAPGPE